MRQKITSTLITEIHFKISIMLCSDSPYTAAMTAGVLTLQESGQLQELKNKWWKKERGGGTCKVSLLL